MIEKIIKTVIVTILLLFISVFPVDAQVIFQKSSEIKFRITDIQKENWVLIICAGAKPNQTEGKAGAGPIRNTSKHVYETFKQLGYDDDHIYYLHDVNSSAEGADGIVSKINIRYAIIEWLKINSDSNDNCCIIFNGHGGPGLISVWNNESEIAEFILFSELAEWLDTLEYDLITIIIDSCFSGSLIRSLSKENRIVISSTSPLSLCIALNELVFSYHFFNKLVQNVSYGKAWEHADKQIARINITKELFPNIEKISLKIRIKIILLMFLQNPKIDDNGDKWGHGTLFANKLPFRGDGILALETYPNKNFT